MVLALHFFGVERPSAGVQDAQELIVLVWKKKSSVLRDCYHWRTSSYRQRESEKKRPEGKQTHARRRAHGHTHTQRYNNITKGHGERGCEYSRGLRAAVWLLLLNCLMLRSTASSFTELRGALRTTTEDIQRKGWGGRTKQKHKLPNQSITCPKLKSHEVRFAAPVCSTAQSLRRRILDQTFSQSASVCIAVKPGERRPQLVLNKCFFFFLSNS